MIGAALLIAGIGILYFSGDWLVSGSTALARHLKIKPFVIAMTLVAFGTSAPELAISVNAAIKGYEGITLGNIVGSNIANILFAMPIAFLIRTPATSDLKLRDKLFLFIITLIYSFILIKVDYISFHIGLSMVSVLIAYIFLIIYEAKTSKKRFESEDGKVFFSLHKSLLFSLIGIVGVLVGAEILVKGAVIVAQTLNVSQTIIGLTLVAIGTSIPEVVTSVVAAFRGQINFILGAILGSNLFNLLGITGVASMITPISINNTLQTLDIFYLNFSMIAFIVIAIFLKFLNKTLFVLLLISYLIYVLFLYIRI